MSNIHVEYTSGLFHKHLKKYMHYGRVMTGVVNIVYLFPLQGYMNSSAHIDFVNLLYLPLHCDAQ